MTDWEKEAGKIGSSNFWKPETGTHKVKFLDDGTPTVYKGSDKRETEQLTFKVLVNGEPKDWSVTKAMTVNSLYGQIALLGRFHGSLAGKEMTLLVKFDQKNDKREYTVQEALPLIDEHNKRMKAKQRAPV